MRQSLLVAAAASTMLVAALGGTASARPAFVADASSASNSAATSLGYIVVLKEGTDSGKVANEHSRTYGATVSHIYRSALQGYSAQMSATAAARVAEDPRVQFVERDGLAYATKGKPVPPPVEQPVQSLPTGINRANADASRTAAIAPTTTIDGSDAPVNVDVAVIDTGVDLNHPDLNVWTDGAKNCNGTSTSAEDGNGHGTHVSGTIGALDNTIGVVGMAPGARIWPVRVLNNRGSGTWSQVICGIDYVTANSPLNALAGAPEIEVANMSLGGSGSDAGGCDGSALHLAICNSVAAGITYVVAAGNSSADASTFVPAAYAEVITVSALADFNGVPGGEVTTMCRLDGDDTFADFSNYGEDVDLIAPGVCIRSTWKGDGYNTISGTSMASPHVAGGAALYKATAAGATAAPAQVQTFLQGIGTFDWDNFDGHDTTQEPLLNVSTF